MHAELEVLLHVEFGAVFSKRLVHVVGVQHILGVALLRRVSLPLVEDLLADKDVVLQLLNVEDVVDLDIMGREAVVEEVGREHHAVTSEPEFGLILSVEVEHVSAANKTETGEDHVRGHTPNKHARVVKGSVLHSNEARKNGSLHGKSLIDHDPPVVNNFHESIEAMGTHLTLANLKGAEDATNWTSTFGEALVDEVLQALRVPEDEMLKSFRHL